VVRESRFACKPLCCRCQRWTSQLLDAEPSTPASEAHYRRTGLSASTLRRQSAHLESRRTHRSYLTRQCALRLPFTCAGCALLVVLSKPGLVTTKTRTTMFLGSTIDPSAFAVPHGMSM
jgi:hypothetical protein